MKINNSFWLNSFKTEKFNALEKDIKVDVCIVGGGLTGISTAYYLSKKGYKVVVIERDTIASKTTGHTTAKITSQHGLFYKYLIDSKGENFAKKYLKANEEAIKNIKEIINSEKIECDFENKDAYVFTQNINKLQNIKDEVKAVQKLGIVDCEFTDKIDINLDIKGAIKFKRQAQFNPIKFINGLTNCIIQNKGQIFENTSFVDYTKNENKFEILTSTKNIIKSNFLVIATRYPIINFPGYYFLKMYQEMSYVIAIKPKNKFNINGMYINSENPTLSIKTVKNKNEDIILIGGYGNKVGINNKISNQYEILKKKAQEIFGQYELLYEWNTEDCISLDKIPYIGEFSHFIPKIYVATGFDKWGMTTSNISANIIADEICNIKNEYSEVFKSTRLEPLKNEQEMKNMIKQSMKSLITDKLKNVNEIIDNVTNGDGKIVMIDDEKVGVYKDEEGNIYAVKPICTHLGCELSWNNLNKTWDCPCHGSRFDYTGKILYGPSKKNLEKIFKIDNKFFY